MIIKETSKTKKKGGGGGGLKWPIKVNEKREI